MLFIDEIFYLIGNGFLHLIQALVVPLVFCSLVYGNMSMGDMKKLGKIGVKTLGLYLVTTALAITAAIPAAQMIDPGAGLDPSALGTVQVTIGEKEGLADTFLAIIPVNPVRASADGNMLPITLLALTVGMILAGLGEAVQTVGNLFSRFNDVMMQMTVMVMKLAPYGVFCLTARTSSGISSDVLLLLFRYMTGVMIAPVIQRLVVCMVALRGFTRLSPVRFLKKFLPVMGFAFPVATSNAAILVSIDTLHEKMGVLRRISPFTIPLGITINMDDTTIMQGVAVVFASQASGIRLSVTNYLTVILAATLASVGVVDAPGVGLITLSMVFASVDPPVEAIALIMGIDRILDVSRTAASIIGDAVCTTVVTFQDGGVNRAILEDMEAGRDRWQAAGSKQWAILRNSLTYFPLDFVLVLYLVVGTSMQEGNVNISGFEIKSKEGREQEEREYLHRIFPGGMTQKAPVEQQLGEKLPREDRKTVMLYCILARDAMIAGNGMSFEEAVGRVSKEQWVFGLTPAILGKMRETTKDNR